MKNKIILAIILNVLILPAICLSSPREEAVDSAFKVVDMAEDYFPQQDRKFFKENYNSQSTDFRQDANHKTMFGLNGYFYISGGYDINYIYYHEIVDGHTLDSDYGRQDGFYGAVGFRSNTYLSEIFNTSNYDLDFKPYIEVYYRRYEDLLKYDGGASSGGITYPFKHREKSEVERFGLKLGGYNNLNKKTELYGYLDFGKRSWLRGENEFIYESYGAVACYEEIYWWYYVGLGFGANYRILPRLSVGLDFEWMPALKSEMIADNWYFTNPEETTFELENVYGIDTKIPIKYYITKNLSLDATPYFTYWNIDASAVVATSGGNYYEPDSHTKIFGVTGGLTYSF